MLRQYGPQRFRYAEIGGRMLAIGTIPVGTTFNARDTLLLDARPRKLMVEAWRPREIGAGRMVNGKYQNSYAARGGHIAIVRDLSNGRRIELGDSFIRFALNN